jgi:protein TonB
VYPAAARAARIEGKVILEAIIDERGTVDRLRVLQSYPFLDAAAMDAVSKWRYSPTQLNGVPVPVLMTITITFRLQD